MRGRFAFLDAGYVDEIAIAKSRNPYYRENPPGVGNEPIELPVLYGLLDFLIYVLIIFPIALANHAWFFVWIATIPFAFLSTVMPVGPVSAWYWRKMRGPRPTKSPIPTEEQLTALRARRQWLQELALESIKVESELASEMDRAGDLRHAFEAQIRQAQQTRGQIGTEIAKIDSQLASIQVLRNL